MFKTTNNIQKNENETIEEFNQRFNGIIKEMSQDYKPLDNSLLDQYLEAFCVDTSYEIRRARPTDLATTQAIVEELEKDRKAFGKSGIHGFERGLIRNKGKEITEV